MEFTSDTNETICYGIPINSLTLISIYAVYCSEYYISLSNFYSFHIMSLYLKMKINSLNERLIEMQRRKRFLRIRETLQSFDSLYSEINEYNTTFWSKILFSFWTLLGTLNVFLLSVVLFSKLNLFITIFLNYFLVFWSINFLMIIFTTSSVTYCANKSYKTLNSLIISYSKHNKHFYYTRTSIISKVKI